MPITLDQAQFVNVETFKKDGSGVKTPIWAAPLDGKLVFHTDGSTYKTKRLRNNPRVRLAACNGSGKQILGPWYDGTARFIDGGDAVRADAALNAKYGFKRRAFYFVSKLFGRMKDPVMIEITVGEKSTGA